MRSRLALVLAMTVVASGSADAQSGVWVSAGGGPARNRVSCESCEDITSHWGAGGFVGVGGVVSRNVLVGGELNFWQATVEDQDVYVRGVQAVVLWYPSPPGGFFGQAGLGLSRIRNSFDVGGESVRGGETGLGVTAGIGWAFPLGKEIYLTPRVASVVIPVATIDTPAGPLDNVVSTIYRFELALTFR
ncbi:MAG TPA: hypothetical protein VFO59_03305 [Dehalococcoidia bacterium]|nr:hypothetical protein [Dehalococcoidia bacterium]